MSSKTLRGEESIVELCCKEAIERNFYCRCLTEFLGAGNKRLVGDTAWEATSDEATETATQARQ